MPSFAQPTRFITFEGGEGAGKSTQAARLAERLRELGSDCVVTREPGGTPFAEDLRAALLHPRDTLPSPLSQALVFYAARADHLDKVIVPALARGAFVICDRFSDSTRIYQGAAGGVAPDDLARLEDIVLGPVRPRLTFVMDLPVTVGLARVAARRAGPTAPPDSTKPDMFEARDPTFHEALRQGFLQLAAAEPARCSVIDASQSPDEVADAIWRTAATVFGL